MRHRSPFYDLRLPAALLRTLRVSQRRDAISHKRSDSESDIASLTNLRALRSDIGKLTLSWHVESTLSKSNILKKQQF